MGLGKIIGYKRVSSFDQNADRQLDGIKTDRTFVDYASGKDTNRPQLEALINYIRDGDTLVVHSFDRLARSQEDLSKLVKTFTGNDIKVQFIKENVIFTGEDSPTSNLLLSIMGSVAEFERALIRERQREGIALAKKRGVYKGRKASFTPEEATAIKERVSNGEKKSHIAKSLGVSRVTLYKYLQVA